MTTTITCECGKSYRAPDSAIGRRVNCRRCGRPLMVVRNPAPASHTYRCVDCHKAFSVDEVLEDEGEIICRKCYHSSLRAQRRNRLIVIASIAVGVLSIGAGLLYLSLHRHSDSTSLAYDDTPTRYTSKVDTSKVDARKVDTLKVDAPKVDIPKVETPKVDTPKIETPKIETPKDIVSRKLLGTWKLKDSEWIFRPDGYVTSTWSHTHFFLDPSSNGINGMGYKLRYRIDKDGTDTADVTLTVMELHTRREASAQATVTFSGDDEITFVFKGQPSQLAGLAVPEKKALQRVGRRDPRPSPPTKDVTEAESGSIRSKLIGKWNAQSGGLVFDFREDGVLQVTHAQGTNELKYSVNPDAKTLTLEYQGDSIASAFDLQGDRLVISSPDGAKTFVRDGVESQPSDVELAIGRLVGKWEGDGVTLSVEKSGDAFVSGQFRVSGTQNVARSIFERTKVNTAGNSFSIRFADTVWSLVPNAGGSEIQMTDTRDKSRTVRLKRQE